ncbi:hypothetical protein [Burkholderia sp. Bp8963]|uniref:hypothetical protein n=1 Tax=Burkholderia sp. Bp8963 TaxID=2184547 RepID=UPI000F5930A2|nr:hypothetical protein [Burkholderia sp. Bp8963]
MNHGAIGKQYERMSAVRFKRDPDSDQAKHHGTTTGQTGRQPMTCRPHPPHFGEMFASDALPTAMPA